MLAHDVIEHVPDKEGFLRAAARFLKPDGTAFFGFPAWYMPFGGHQQISHNGFISHMPFIHLLPMPFYTLILGSVSSGESEMRELLNIRATRTTIEHFEKTARKAGLSIYDRHFWFINPHYKAKFGLTPRTLWKPLAAVPYLRDFFTTSAFYLLKLSNK